jgi:hypothetical protein
VSRGLILQHDNATHTAAVAVMSPASSGPPAILFELLSQYWEIDDSSYEMVVREKWRWQVETHVNVMA